MSRNSSASDASKIGPATRSQLLSASFVWLIAARADFDQAGLQHVAALLKGVPAARPWRMGAADYEASLATTPVDDRTRLRPGALQATPWDPALQHLMEHRGLAAYEESLIETLLVDLTNGSTPE